MTLWYYETRTPTGGWMPNTSADEPLTQTTNSGLHLRRIGGFGKQVRAVARILPEHEALSLKQIARLYSGAPPQPATATPAPTLNLLDAANHAQAVAAHCTAALQHQDWSEHEALVEITQAHTRLTALIEALGLTLLTGPTEAAAPSSPPLG